MSWNVCKQPECEAYTARPDGDYCESCRRKNAKDEQDERKQSDKRKARKKISKNPKDWSNTFLCSDGHRVAQSSIESNYKQSKVLKYGGKEVRTCEGCGTLCNSNAHIIAKARCKQIGKTELIWHFDNYFPACYKCNAAIENPKGQAWKELKNIDKCMQFIYEHDKELFFKFEDQGWSESRLQTVKQKI